MIKDVAFELSVAELFSLFKMKWKLIGIIALICMVVCGAYKAMSYEMGSQQTQQAKTDTMEIEQYELFQSNQKQASDLLKNQWLYCCLDRVQNPIFSLDPYACEYEQIVILFDGEQSANSWLLSNWISEADDSILFGSKDTPLSKYKNSIILVAEDDMKSGDLAVQLLSVHGFDVEKGSDYLIKHFKECALRDKISIKGFSKVKQKGFNKTVFDYQNDNSDAISAIYTSIERTEYAGRYITEPAQDKQSHTRQLLGLVKYMLFGLFIGLIIGCACITARVFRNSTIISPRQIEDSFGLELINDCSHENEVTIKMVNAYLDVMTGEKSKIMIAADSSVNDVRTVTDKWSNNSNHNFIVCTDLIDNPEMIEELKTTDGIILGVKIGESKLSNLKRIVSRADSLNQRVIGYILY